MSVIPNEEMNNISKENNGLKALAFNAITYMLEQGLDFDEIIEYCGTDKETLESIGFTL